MRIDFSAVPDRKTGEVTAREYENGTLKVVPCRVAPGGVIAYHRHDGEQQVIYVLYGTGEAVVDGTAEPLSTDICHICPAGCGHEIRNTGNTDLVMLTVAAKC